MLEDVRALPIDLDGILYVAQEPTAGGAEAVRRLRERGYQRVALIINEQVQRDFNELQEPTGRADG
jgi:ribonucleotide monophosphatase NagD (HAD superfamily)